MRVFLKKAQTMESVHDHEYINIEVDPLATIFCHSNKEFEFQSFTSSSETNCAAICSADQLFYMGKLLPLHLPPRLQMLDKILQTSKPSYELDGESFSTPLFSASNTCTANTPFESCNVSPVESCQVSGELNPNDYFLEYSTCFKEKKYSWAKRLRMIKQSSSIGSKLKRAFLKSLFTKSGCSYESAAASDAKKALPKARDSDKAGPSTNVVPFGQIQAVKCSNKKMMLTLSNKENNVTKDCQAGHRRSFSGAFKRLSKSASSMSDYSRSAGVKNMSCGTNLELENSIQAAIAHCKRSQNQPCSKSIASDQQILCPMPASSQVIFDDQERSGRCRG